MDANVKALAKKRASLFRVFGNARRVLILWALGEEEVSVSEIASMIDASLQSTSQHLRIMKNKGIVTSRREGQTVYYRINDLELVDQCEILLQKPES